MTSIPRASLPFRPGFLIAGMAACAMLTACANSPMSSQGSSQANAGTTMQTNTADSRQDTAFLTRAMQSDMLEISASQLALKRAGNEQVRQFAQRMVQDHTANSAELKQLAANKGMTSQPSMLPADTAKLQKLQNAQGTAFDRLYAEMIGVQAHTEAVALFEQQAAQGTDMDLRAFAAQKLPTLQHHLQMGQALQGSMR